MGIAHHPHYALPPATGMWVCCAVWAQPPSSIGQLHTVSLACCASPFGDGVGDGS